MKALRNWHLPMVIATFGLVLGLGLVAQYWFHSYSVVGPLSNDFSELEAIDEFTLDDPRADLIVKLAPVDDLQSVFRQIRIVGDRTLRSDLNNIIILDTRTPELQDLYYKIHFDIYTGIETGQFADMAKTIENTLAGLKHHRVQVARDFVFVELRSDEGYLYEVIPRGESLINVSTERGEQL